MPEDFFAFLLRGFESGTRRLFVCFSQAGCYNAQKIRKNNETAFSLADMRNENGSNDAS
jgi:hypothetical protein